MSCKVQQSVCSDCVTYVKSKIKFNTFNTFNNVTQIPLKYRKETLIPDEIVKGVKPRDKQYTLITGETVTIEYRRTCDNRGGAYTADLEKTCQEYFGLPFSYVSSCWIFRLGKVSDYWHWVRLTKVEEGRK